MSPERIAELRALLAKGSAGPWDTSVDARGTAVFGGGDMVTLCRHVAAGNQARANAELIAAMRNALPDLLAEVERLTKQRDDAIAGVVIAAGKAWDDCTDNGVYRKEEFLKYLGRAIAADQPKHDWPEDAADADNGQYQCLCSVCGASFVGHKRRVECKVCAEQPKPAESREWWEVFGMERWEATRMHSLKRDRRERHIHHLADKAHKRGIDPNEIARAMQDAAEELLGEQPKPEVQP